MKLLIKSACIAFVLAVMYSVIPFHADSSSISNEVFRLHIPANSDSKEDQELKLRVRDRVLGVTEELFSSAKSKSEAERLVAGNLQEIANVAADEVRSCGYNYDVKAEITKMYFTTRHYDDYTLPSGMYDALRITIGSGKGHNWWCVMYPSICVSAALDKDDRARSVFSDSEYELVKYPQPEYKFKIVEIFEKIRSLWNQG